MDVNDVKRFVKEMFPHVEDCEIEHLVKTNGNLDSIVSKILTGEYKEFKINLKEMVLKHSHTVTPASRELYFPEIFNSSFIDEHIDVDDVRRQASELYEQASGHSKKDVSYKARHARDYYVEETDCLIERAKELNRRAALVVIKRSIRNPRLIDLHGLYVREALMFLSDFISRMHPREFGIVTGQEKTAGTLRPSVISMLRKNRYSVSEEGPCVYAKKMLP